MWAETASEMSGVSHQLTTASLEGVGGGRSVVTGGVPAAADAPVPARTAAWAGVTKYVTQLWTAHGDVGRPKRRGNP